MTVELVVFDKGDTVNYQGIAAWIIDPDGGIGPVIRMVGDDRDFEVYPEELTHVTADEFCGGCGQIGCGHG